MSEVLPEFPCHIEPRHLREIYWRASRDLQLASKSLQIMNKQRGLFITEMTRKVADMEHIMETANCAFAHAEVNVRRFRQMQTDLALIKHAYEVTGEDLSLLRERFDLRLGQCRRLANQVREEEGLDPADERDPDSDGDEDDGEEEANDEDDDEEEEDDDDGDDQHRVCTDSNCSDSGCSGSNYSDGESEDEDPFEVLVHEAALRRASMHSDLADEDMMDEDSDEVEPLDPLYHGTGRLRLA